MASDGGAFSYGTASFYGSAGALPLNKPVVGMAATPDGGGYYLVASDGGVFSYGDATFQGSTGGDSLNKPIVGMAVDPTTGGYWLVASDGGVFAFNAPFYGSTGNLKLNEPIVGMAETPDGGGYYLLASDGGIFSFGDAAFHGSTGALHLNKPIVGMSIDQANGGYWLVASDGGVFSFGGAPFYGSTGALSLNKPVVGMSATSDGAGYYMVASDGGIFSYGDAGFEGSAGGTPLNKPIVGMAVVPTDDSQVMPRADTLVLPAARATSVSGDPNGPQTVSLTAGTAPVVGGFLVLPTSDSAPDGLLGQVTSVRTTPQGAIQVTTVPASLNQAYAAFNVSYNEPLSSAELRPHGASGAQSAASLRDGADQTAASLSAVPFTCSGSDQPTVEVTADLSNIISHVHLDIATPSLEVLFNASPVFNLNVGFTGQASCSIADSEDLDITIPVSAAPPLVLTLSPVFEIDADGTVGVNFTWSPTITLGFQRGGGNDYDEDTFNSSASVTPTGSASATVYLALSVNLSLAGRLGIGGDFGPELTVAYANSCLTVDTDLKADLTADVNVFVTDWTITLASGTFDSSRLYSQCNVSGPTPANLQTETIASDREGFCTIVGSGGVKCWGDNNDGELGDGTTADSDVPQQVTGLTDPTSLVSSDSGNDYCAITTKGTIECWGANDYGQLGDGTTTSSDVPVTVSGISNAAKLTSSGASFCADSVGGQVSCWGFDGNGELGDGSDINSSVPIDLSGIANTATILGGTGATDGYCAISTAGGVNCWGADNYGQLGDGTTANSSDSPVQVIGISDATSISNDGGASYCVVTAAQTVQCWGDNVSGELGNGMTTNSSEPVDVSGLQNVEHISSDGDESFCALLSNGGISCWGNNSSGDLGDGTMTQSSVPMSVSNVNSVTEFTSAAITNNNSSSYCVVLSGGGVDCWGDNTYGEIGNGILDSSAPYQDVPSAVVGVTKAVSLASNSPFTNCAIMSDGTIDCWGYGGNGELGNGYTNDSDIPVQVSGITDAVS